METSTKYHTTGRLKDSVLQRYENGMARMVRIMNRTGSMESRYEQLYPLDPEFYSAMLQDVRDAWRAAYEEWALLKTELEELKEDRRKGNGVD